MASHMCAVSRLESAPLGFKVAPRDDDEAAGVPAAAAAAARAKAAAAASSTSPSSSTVITTTATSIPDDATPSEPSRLRYSYYVAGSGGAGPAVLAATLLLAGRDAAAWKDGAKLTRRAFSEPLPADFGRFIGRKTVYLIDLPEVEAAAVDLRVPSVSARFATAPGVFNLGTVLLARLLPKSVLGDRTFAASAASVLAPLVAAADAMMKVLPIAIRVDLELKKKMQEEKSGEKSKSGGSGESATDPRRDRRRDDPFLRGDDEQASSSAFVHRDMATAVGACTAAFARELLFGQGGDGRKNSENNETIVPAGVCRPEALPAASRARILRDVAENSGAARFEVGAPPWALDSEPTRLGEFFFFFPGGVSRSTEKLRTIKTHSLLFFFVLFILQKHSKSSIYRVWHVLVIEAEGEEEDEKIEEGDEERERRDKGKSCGGRRRGVRRVER